MGNWDKMMRSQVANQRLSATADAWQKMRQIEGNLAVEHERNKVLAKNTENEVLKQKYEQRAKALDALQKARETGMKLSATLKSKGFSDDEIRVRIEPLLKSYIPIILPNEEAAQWLAQTMQEIQEFNEEPKNQPTLQARAEAIAGGKLPPGAAVGTTSEGNPYVQNAVYNKQYNAQQEGIIQQAEQGKGFIKDAADRLLPDQPIVNPRTFAMKKFAEPVLNPISAVATAGLGIPASPLALKGEERILDTALSNMRNIVAYLYSGKQINELERKGLRSMIPTDSEIARGDKKVIKYKLDTFYKMYTGILKRMQGVPWNAETGQYDMPEGEVLPESTQRTQALPSRPRVIGGITISQ